MTLDEAIKHGEEQLEIFGGTHGKFIETSIDIMRKYQKIKEAVNNWHHNIEAKDFECMAEIADVVEDWNDDFVKEHKHE